MNILRSQWRKNKQTNFKDNEHEDSKDRISTMKEVSMDEPQEKIDKSTEEKSLKGEGGIERLVLY